MKLRQIRCTSKAAPCMKPQNMKFHPAPCHAHQYKSDQEVAVGALIGPGGCPPAVYKRSPGKISPGSYASAARSPEYSPLCREKKLMGSCILNNKAAPMAISV